MSQETQNTDLKPLDIADFIDTLVASDHFKDYVYSYSQGNKSFTGLSARAYEHISKDRDISITKTKIKEDRDKEGKIIGITISARATIEEIIPSYEEVDSEGNVKKYKEVRKKRHGWGVKYEKFDAHAHNRCMTKACARAISRLVPKLEQEECKKRLLELQGGKATPVPNTSQSQSTQSKSNTPQETQVPKGNPESKFKELSTLWEDREADLLNKLNINKFTFWSGVKVKCGVYQRKDLTVPHINMIINSLNSENYPKWIQDLKSPSVKVKLFAILEERKKDLPKDIADQVMKKAGVKAMERLSLHQAKICWEHISKLLGMDTESESEVETEEQEAAEGTPATKPETNTAKTDDNKIPF